MLADDAIAGVSVIDDLSTGSRDNLASLDVDVVDGSILDDDALDRAFDGAAAVVHLAALGSVPRSVLDPLASHHANATGTLKVLEAARRHGNLHTIVASSSSVYGANPTLPKHEELATPSAVAVRGQQVGHRVVHAGVGVLVRAARAGVPVLQRLRSPATCRVTPTPP